MKSYRHKYYWDDREGWFLPDDEFMMQGQFPILDEQVEAATDAVAKAGKDIPPRTVVQAGGAFGIYPLALSHYFERVITFEPLMENLQCMAVNLGNQPNITVEEYALWHTRDIPLQMAYSKPVKNSYGAHHVGKSGQHVTSVTIDQYELEDVDLIWLDVEGAELHAIQGADLTIQRCRPVIILEDRALRHMRELGVSQGQAVRHVCERWGYKPDGKTAADTILMPRKNF